MTISTKDGHQLLKNAYRRHLRNFLEVQHDMWPVEKIRELRNNSRRRRGKLTPPPDPKEVHAETYGEPIALNYGTFRHTCSVIWADKIKPHFPDPNNDNIGGGTDDPNAALWACSFAVKVCDGEQGALMSVRANGHTIFQAGATGITSFPQYASHIRFYPGDDTQDADPTISDVIGASETPTYRHTCYIVFRDLPLARFDNTIPTIEAEVASAPTPDYSTEEVAITAVDSTDDADNFVISKTTDLAYVLSVGLLSVVQRSSNTLIGEFDVSDIVASNTAGAINPAGRICIEEGGGGFFGILEPIYLFCADGADSYIFKFGSTYANNYDTRIAGEETVGYVLGDLLFTADGSAGKIYCYNKNTLARKWSRKGPSAGLDAGTFTHDNHGVVWFTWLDAGDPDTTYITRITSGGNVTNTAVSNSNGGALGVAYDTNADILVTGGASGARLSFWTPSTTPALLGTVNSVSGTRSRSLFVAQSRYKNSFWAYYNDVLKRYRTITRVLKETINVSDYVSPTSTEGLSYNFADNAFYAVNDTAPTFQKLPLNRFTSGAQPCADVIEDLLEDRADYAATDYDATDVNTTPTVAGYGVIDRMPVAPALQKILDAYQLATREHFESGYSAIKMEFVKRSTSAATIVATIPYAHLGFGENEPEEVPLVDNNSSEEDLASIVTVRYTSKDRKYSTHQQQATLPPEIMQGQVERAIDCVNVVLTDDQAKQLAENEIRAQWIEGELKTFTLGMQYLYIEPEDHIAVTTDSGWAYTMRVEQKELGANWLLSFQAVVTDVDVWTNTSTGAPADEDPPVLVPQPLSRPFLFDIPACRDVDGLPQDGGFYGGVAPLYDDAGSWQGAQLVRSIASGTSYESCAGFNAGMNYGTLTAALADASDCTTYHASDTLTFTKGYGDDWADSTEAALYQDRTHNLIAVGNESRGWELIQFTNYTDNGNGTATITGMLRGQFGTERLSTAHGTGETIALLDFDTPTIKRIPLPLADRGQAHLYKAVTAGTSLASAPALSFINDCASLKPYQVTHVVGELSTPLTNDITINFFRRSRLGFDLIDEFDIPVNEDEYKFEIDIRENSAAEDVVRTLTIDMDDFSAGGTLSIDGPTQRLHAVGHNFITQGGFVKGQYIDIGGDGFDGFVNAANNGRFLITAITATDLTLSGITTLVTESAPATTPDVRAATPGIRYAEADQVTDLGVPKGQIHVSIYQLSKTLEDGTGDGRGFVYQALLP